jgi:hypothetical protein
MTHEDWQNIASCLRRPPFSHLHRFVVYSPGDQRASITSAFYEAAGIFEFVDDEKVAEEECNRNWWSQDLVAGQLSIFSTSDV